MVEVALLDQLKALELARSMRQPRRVCGQRATTLRYPSAGNNIDMRSPALSVQHADCFIHDSKYPNKKEKGDQGNTS